MGPSLFFWPTRPQDPIVLVIEHEHEHENEHEHEHEHEHEKQPEQNHALKWPVAL
jgi:hypothetical protein